MEQSDGELARRRSANRARLTNSSVGRKEWMLRVHLVDVSEQSAAFLAEFRRISLGKTAFLERGEGSEIV